MLTELPPLDSAVLPPRALHGQELCAPQQNRTFDVRYGSKADIAPFKFNVRYSPESGHGLTRS